MPVVPHSVHVVELKLASPARPLSSLAITLLDLGEGGKGDGFPDIGAADLEAEAGGEEAVDDRCEAG